MVGTGIASGDAALRQTEVPIVLARRPRRLGEAWAGARSWFGGLPQLGGQPWPRSKKGVPLVFVAQIDLGELSAFRTGVPMPKEGSLAFFVDEGAVVYVPPSASRTPTQPPADLLPAFEHEGDIFPQKPSPFAEMQFPYWPVSFAALDVGNTRPDFDDEDACEASDQAMSEAVSALFPGRDEGLGNREIAALMQAGGIHGWWRAPILYLQQCRLSTVRGAEGQGRLEAALTKAQAQVDALTPKKLFGVFGRKPVDDPALKKAEQHRDTVAKQIEARTEKLARLPGYFAELERFVAGRDPWSAMTEAEAAAFKALHAKRRTEFDSILSSWTSYDVANLTRRGVRDGDGKRGRLWGAAGRFAGGAERADARAVAVLAPDVRTRRQHPGQPHAGI